MGWSLFMEEPGNHQLTLPYGALAGLAVEDRLIWQLARKLKHAEVDFFGSRLVNFRSLFTIDSILDVETVQIANSSLALNASTRLNLVKECSSQSQLQLSTQHTFAMAQARILFCKHVLELMLDYSVKSFATIIPTEQIEISYSSGLRKDYSFFFERFSLFLGEQPSGSTGTLVLDATRHNGRYVSIQSVTDYFERTAKGRLMSQSLIPEPLMANASLSVINQAAVIFSYVLSHGVRLSGMTSERRYDIDSFVKISNKMRTSFPSKEGRKQWSIIYLDDVRTIRATAGPI